MCQQFLRGFYFFTLMAVFQVPMDCSTVVLPSTNSSASNTNETQNAIQNSEEIKCGEDQQLVSPLFAKPRCCNKCGPGYGMLLLCTDNTETQCRDCKVGTEYSASNSASDKCKQCSKCTQLLGELSQVKSNCTSVSDTVCECKPGAYLSDGKVCRRCTQCEIGSGVVQKCKFDRDSKCEPCKKGFFSSKISAESPCQQCTICSVDMVEVRKCTPQHDRICCPKYNRDCAPKDKTMNDRSNKSILNKKGSVWTDHIDNSLNNKNSSNSDVEYLPTANEQIPIYCAIMGLVIVGLIFYVVYKHWRQRQSNASGKLSNNNSGFIGFDQKKAPIYKMSKPDQHGQSLIRVVCTDGSEINRKQRHSSPKQDDRLLCELPEKHLLKVEASIMEVKNGIGWKELAHELGYAPAEISAFEVNENIGSRDDQSGNNNMDLDSAVHRMMTDWTARDTATVSCLAKALEKIGRRDTLHLLRPASKRGQCDKYNNTPPYINCQSIVDPESSKCPLVSQNSNTNTACQEMGRL